MLWAGLELSLLKDIWVKTNCGDGWPEEVRCAINEVVDSPYVQRRRVAV
jgi:hypothetical protein